MIGARLKQARLLAGMTQKDLKDSLADRGYQVTTAAISKYENDKSFPPGRYLITACNALGVSSPYLYHRPEKSVKWAAFRRHTGLPQKKQDTIKTYAADLAELQIELHSLLYPDARPDLPSAAPANEFADAEKLAEDLRSVWDVGNRPLDNLVQTAEDRGVIVIGWHDDSGKFDGLSGCCGAYPVTVINQNRSADRIRFTLAHEIGHLVMDTSNAVEDEEKLAHRFAAALLVPKAHAYRELGMKRNSSLQWGEIKILKRKYGLSMAAWVRRARDLQIITENRYQEMNIELSSKKWRLKEPVDYLGDEEPILLKQMASRAVSEGLISSDRITRISQDILSPVSAHLKSGQLTVYDLLAMPEAERNAVMAQAFATATKENYELFEDYDIYDEYDPHYDS
ncbi:MAG: XRE family transcriptional regulator [Chloroflexi bacterium]|nr:XRE family transcriptional regulator [Chloroflexota bacterium]